jgi:hypothetical protein
LVDGLIQELARVLVVAVGPEKAQQPVTRRSALAGQREEGKEREAVTLDGSPSDVNAVRTDDARCS